MGGMERRKKLERVTKVRKIGEFEGHSVLVPGIDRGNLLLDLGSNHGRFLAAICERFSLDAVAVEPNPALASELRSRGYKVVDAAIGASDGYAEFQVGQNDESSSLREPLHAGTHLQVERTVPVRTVRFATLLWETGLDRVGLIKVDVEGAEIDLFNSLTPRELHVSPQWTVEFHDDAEFGLCSRAEVDGAIRRMTKSGFSVLVRNWPSRSNVLFVDRRRLEISWLQWAMILLRYQWIAWVWRCVRVLKWKHRP